MKHFSFSTNLNRFLSDNEEDFQHVRLARSDNSGGKKFLFVLDYMPKEDLKSGKLLSGDTGTLFENILQVAKQKFGGNQDFSWVAVTFNAFRTFGKDRSVVAEAQHAFKKRIDILIDSYKPDVVFAFGKLVAQKFIPDVVEKTGKYITWLGVPVERETDTHKYTFLYTLSLEKAMKGGESAASLLGLVCLHVSWLYGAKYVAKDVNINSIMIDTLSKFKKLMNSLEDWGGPVSIDTETRNLSIFNNKLLSIQFSMNEQTGYFLPIYHKDSPFLPDELKYISTRLRAYFEGENNNSYHIYANAVFDLTVLYKQLKVVNYANDLWDIFAGEFVLDENIIYLSSASGELGEHSNGLSLFNLSIKYGINDYIDAVVSKQDRANIQNLNLDDELVKYGTLDVCSPFAIHTLQQQRAKRIGYTKYSKVVRFELGDTLHAFSRMRYNGNKLDLQYLFYLNSDQSPIKTIINTQFKKLCDSKAGKKLNTKLCKEANIPQTGLFGESAVLIKDKPVYMNRLFFEIMGLEPVSKTKSGADSIDSDFQEHYKDIEEVKLFTEIQKSKKIRDGFIKAFIQRLRQDVDVQITKYIRSDYSFFVVSHRTASAKPNLQNLPSRGYLSKYIKRLFVSKVGFLIIKVDYSAHEVRGWGIVSGDKVIASLFDTRTKLIEESKLYPSPELTKKIKFEGDIHRQNASVFFHVKILGVTEELRNKIKSVVFGLIYGKGINALAVDINGTKEEAKELLNKFFARFRVASKWLKEVKLNARKYFYVEAPTGIRRNLWVHLLPSSVENAEYLQSRADRQAANSPIQGMCSKMMMTGIRIINNYSFKIKNFSLKTNNSVHDSLEATAHISDLIKSLTIIEHSLTKGVAGKIKQRYGFDLISIPEIDIEIGASLDRCQKWDRSLGELYRICKEELEFQKTELGYELNIQELLVDAFDEANMPKWLIQQKKNTNWKLPKYVSQEKHFS